MERKVKAYKLREKNDEELEAELGKFKEELYQMRTQKVVGATAGKLGKIKVRTRNRMIVNVLAPEEGYRQVSYRDQ